MNINFHALDSPVAIQNLTSLVIENQAVFTHLVAELYAYETESQTDVRLFDNRYNYLKPTELLVITDVLRENLNTPTVLRHIYKDLETHLNLAPERKTAIEDLLAQAWGLLNEELVEFELDLASSKMHLPEAFKGFNIRVDTQARTIFEKIQEILTLYKYLSKKRLLVLVNLSLFLNQQELAAVAEAIELQRLTVLMVDPRSFDPPAGVKQVVMDHDMVVITT